MGWSMALSQRRFRANLNRRERAAGGRPNFCTGWKPEVDGGAEWARAARRTGTKSLTAIQLISRIALGAIVAICAISALGLIAVAIQIMLFGCGPCAL